MVLLSTHNISFAWEIRKSIFDYTLIKVPAHLKKKNKHKVKVGMHIVWHTAEIQIRVLIFPPEETLDPWLPTEHPSKTDQTGLMSRLIRVFNGHICQLILFALAFSLLSHRNWLEMRKIGPSNYREHYQSGPWWKTTQAKNIPFWKEKPSNLTILHWMDFPFNLLFALKIEKSNHSFQIQTMDGKAFQNSLRIGKLAIDRLSDAWLMV